MSKKLNLLNKKFGLLTVIENNGIKNQKTNWRCQCECGDFIDVSGNDLRSNHTQSCGCLRNKTLKTKSSIMMVGKTFNYLTVIKVSDIRIGNKLSFECICKCGNIKITSGKYLRQGKVKSCGCKKVERNTIEQKGEKSHLWKGGITKENTLIRQSVEYKKWRNSVFERDNYCCIFCGSKKDIEADHIKQFAFYKELRFDINNGRTLCHDCHEKTETYKNQKNI